jgi:hypothetical protein
LPAGKYDILERNGRDEFRLVALNSSYGDDHVDGLLGRGLFRLHGPGVSTGCIAACDVENWDAIRDFLNATSTSSTEVWQRSTITSGAGYEAFGMPKLPFRTETLKKCGTLEVE